MLTCPACNAPGRRCPRSFGERITCRAKFRCGDCGRRWDWQRTIFQKYVHCPKCGTVRLIKRSTYDPIDKKNKNWLRKLLGLFGMPIFHCTYCRMQFRDYRQLDPERKSKVQAEKRAKGATSGGAAARG